MKRRDFVLSGLVLAGCGRKAENARVDPALASLIPADTRGLAGIRLDLLKKTPSWDRLFPANGKFSLDDMKRRTGIDVKDDIYELVYCLGGKHPLLLVRGKFTNGGVANSGIEPQLDIEGAQKFPYKGYLLIGKEEGAVTFWNSSVVVAGKAAAIRDLVDGQAKGSAAPERLIGMVKQMPHSAHVYMVSDRPQVPEMGIGGLRSLPMEMNFAKGFIDMTIGAKLKAEIEFVKDGDAKKLNDLLKAGAGMLRMQKRVDGPAAKLFDALVMTGEGTKWTAEGELPMEVLQEGVRMLDGMAGRG